MALTIHHATRLDRLAANLGGILSGAYRTPFDQEIVAVPTRGVQRWLNQRLSHRLHRPGDEAAIAGIAAGIDYRSPRNLVELFLPDPGDAWEPTRLAWHVLAVVDDSAGLGWAEPLRRYFDAGGPGGHRYAAARRIANLLAAYAKERPTMLREWSDGRATDGSHPLDADLAWQVRLYRELRARLAAPPTPLRLNDAIAGAQEHAVRRFHVFGYPRLAAADLEFLEAAAAHTEVHLWVAASTHEWIPGSGADGSALLEALGRQGREYAADLTRRFPQARLVQVEGPVTSLRRATMLEALQADVAQDLPPTRHGTLDGSVQIHSCHGPSRQVEVLREVLTDLFEGDPSLEPRDVLILCPDVEAYAPLFHAAFSSQTGHPGAHLRVNVAEGGPAERNPLFEVAQTLLTMVGGRVRSADVVDLLHMEEVQRRLGIAAGEVETLTAWIKDSGMRWGFDADHRERFGVDSEQNTIQAGLQRLLLAVALPGDAPLGGVLPLGEVGSTQIDLAGVFAEFLSRLHAGVTELEAATKLPQWVSGLQRLLASVAEAEDWQESQLARGLDALARSGNVRASRADFLHALGEIGRSRASAGGLRTGGMTVASFGTLRAVPHKVICLVGMDDAAFPRPATIDGDDALARRIVPGEGNPRHSDRQLFLDALMSATSRLIITFSGAGEQRGEELAPAVPVAQLIDTLRRMTTPDAQPVTSHPLHPFDHRYFDGSGLVSFDERSASAARMRHHPHPPPRFLDQPVATGVREEITLRALQRFFADPVKSFIHDETGVYLTDRQDSLPSAIPIALDPLDAWAVGTRLLRSSKDDNWGTANLELELLRGTVAPGELGKHTLGGISATVSKLAGAAAEHAKGSARSVPIEVQIAGRTLHGKVDDVYGDTIVHATYSTLAPKHRFAAWLDLLALAAGHPERRWRAVVVARSSQRAVTRELRAPEAREARDILADLFDLYDRGVREPLPLPPKTSAAWAEEARKLGGTVPAAVRGEVIAKVAGKWETSNERFSNEDADRYQQLAWGGIVTFTELLEIPASGDERWAAEPSRFGQLAWRMWERMLDHEL